MFVVRCVFTKACLAGLGQRIGVVSPGCPVHYRSRDLDNISGAAGAAPHIRHIIGVAAHSGIDKGVLEAAAHTLG